MSRATRGASARVSAPRPGPISRNVSPASGATAATSLSTQACSRKCCPNLLRAGLATPVLFFDGLDFFFAQPEVVPHFVNQRFADDRANLVLVLAVLLDRPLIDGDAIGQGVAVAP